MVRTQIQLPEFLYRQVERMAKEKGWSLANVIRRGAEYMVQLYPGKRVQPDRWRLPEGKDLGKIKIHHSRWREIAH